MAMTKSSVKNFNPPKESKPLFKDYKIGELVGQVDKTINGERYGLSFELGGQRNIQGKNIWGVQRCKDLIYSMCSGKYIDTISMNKETKEPFRSYIIDGCNRIRCIYWFVKGYFPDGKEFKVQTKGQNKPLAFKEWEANDAEDFLESTISVRETTDWSIETCIDYFLNLHKGISMTKGEKLYATYSFARNTNLGADLVCEMYEKYGISLRNLYETLGISKGLERNIIFEDLARYFYIILNDNVSAYPKSACQLHTVKCATDSQKRRFHKTLVTFTTVIDNASKNLLHKHTFKRPRAMLAVFFAYCVKHIKFKRHTDDNSFQALINAIKDIQDEKWTTLMKDTRHQNNSFWMDETYQYVLHLLSPIQTTGASSSADASASFEEDKTADTKHPTHLFVIKRKRRDEENQPIAGSKKQRDIE